MSSDEERMLREENALLRAAISALRDARREDALAQALLQAELRRIALPSPEACLDVEMSRHDRRATLIAQVRRVLPPPLRQLARVLRHVTRSVPGKGGAGSSAIARRLPVQAVRFAGPSPGTTGAILREAAITAAVCTPMAAEPNMHELSRTVAPVALLVRGCAIAQAMLPALEMRPSSVVAILDLEDVAPEALTPSLAACLRAADIVLVGGLATRDMLRGHEPLSVIEALPEPVSDCAARPVQPHSDRIHLAAPAPELEALLDGCARSAEPVGCLASLIPIGPCASARAAIGAALAAAVPVITTATAADDLGLRAEVEVLVATTASQFDAQLRRLRSDTALRDSLAEAGRTFAAAQLTRAAVQAQAVALLHG